MTKREIFKIESKDKKKKIIIYFSKPTPRDYEKIKKLKEEYEK